MDVPADTTLGTEMGKVSDIVRPMVESMRGEPMDAAREGEGRRGLGLAERSAGLVEDTAGIAGEYSASWRAAPIQQFSGFHY